MGTLAPETHPCQMQLVLRRSLRFWPDRIFNDEILVRALRFVQSAESVKLNWISIVTNWTASRRNLRSLGWDIFHFPGALTGEVRVPGPWHLRR